ncbi:hypothetical protein [Syntrophomonas palmitatica]|nr:hypothetical protein [Syntrophomonas palmitatica]
MLNRLWTAVCNNKLGVFAVLLLIIIGAFTFFLFKSMLSKI